MNKRNPVRARSGKRTPKKALGTLTGIHNLAVPDIEEKGTKQICIPFPSSF